MKYLHGQSVEMERSYYTLKSNRHALNFVSLLDNFRLQELYCDATIACDGKKYPVHQMVLSACSDFFAKIFSSVSCQNPLVVIQDVSSWELEAILTYAYRGEIHIPHCNLQSFLKAGKSLFIKGLMNPHLGKHLESESHSGMWHEPYYNHESRTGGFNGHMDPYGPIPLQRSEEAHRNHQSQQHSSYPSPGPVNGLRISDHLRREDVLERSFRNGHDVDPRKKLHYLPNYPQDLRVTSELAAERHSPRNGSSEYSPDDRARWADEASLEGLRGSAGDIAVDSSPRERKRQKSDTGDRHEAPISKPSRFNIQESKGTFQELIAGDENPIKQEPEDVTTDCDSKELLRNNQNDSDVDEEESPLQIDMLEESLSGSRSNGTTDPIDNSKSYSQMPEPYSRSASDSPTSSQGHMSPTSHLRNELLRPVTQNAVSHLQQQPPRIPLSIPHPVIATREPQPKSQPILRDPPPLMKIAQKIPTLVEECENKREPPQLNMSKDVQASRGNTHLLVTAPPSYHSHNMSFEIHNQHLGPVLVNAGSAIQFSSQSQFSPPKRQHNGTIKKQNNNKVKSINFGYDSETPLNLSGVQRSPSKSPECSSNEDPFLGKIVTNRKKRLRGPKSWEFLVRLLKDPTTNPTLIRWENERDGVFRLVQPAIIAQRWGRRTGKHASENLSYENFARGLRYHYATGALKPVSEKSFVYRFGPKALKLLHVDNGMSFSQA
ncbi:broad-complex core protein isoforms 1/2/3/4/5-like [Palaemon carinicauda]|uniref:broad-complex core protein isoforms 1/2/3/4/5-like n=1 Tax=Palaemon carinicauda TaxID=392227 RepID=UPI0035B5BBB0